MKLETELPAGSDEIQGVPDLLKQHLLRKLRGPAVRVKVEAKTAGASHIMLNSIRLAERGGANTSPDIDAIAELVTKIIHAYHVEHDSEDGYTSQYRVTCEMRSEKNKQPMSERSFVVRYAPGQEDENSELMRENDVLTQALDTLRENNSSLAVQVSDLHHVVLDFARSMVEPIRASSELSHNATQQWINGANLLVQAHQSMYSVESVRISEEAKNQRIASVLDKFGGTLGHLSTGLIDFAMTKMGVKKPGGAQPSAKPAAQASSSAGGPQAVEQRSQADDADDAAEQDAAKGRELSILVEAFSHSITPKQRKHLNEGLTRDQITAIDNLFCAETNDETADTWAAAFQALGVEKLMWMNGLLDIEQQNDFNTIRTYIGRYTEKRDAERKANAAETPTDEPPKTGRGRKKK